MTGMPARKLTLPEAQLVLEAIGYDKSWTAEQLIAACPEGTAPMVSEALAVTADANFLRWRETVTWQ
jgi:hypothetical protein